MAHEGERKYTAEDFDENGEFIRNPLYSIGPNVGAQAIAQDQEEVAAKKRNESIALKKQEITEEKLRLAKTKQKQLAESTAIRGATIREPIQYQRPYDDKAHGIGISPDTARAASGRPTSRDPAFAIETPDKYSHAESAAANGVDVTTGLRPGIRAAASLLDFDPKAQQMAIENEVRNDLGPDFPVHEMVIARDPASGMVSYLRPEEEGYRWTLVNPPGTDVGDFAEWVGELPTFTMDIAGSIGGAIAGHAVSPGAGTVFGAAIGASALTYASIPLRIKLAKLAGIPDAVLDTIDVHDEAKWMALMSGGMELAGHGIIGTVTSVRNFLGRSLDVNDLPFLEAKIKERAKIIKKAEDAGDVTFKPTVGQLTGDSNIQVAEATLKGKAQGTAARELRVAEVDNLKATTDAMRNMATQEVRAPGASGFRSVEEISEEAQERLVARELDKPAAKSDAAQTEVDKFDQRYAAASDKEKYSLLQERSADQFTEIRRLEKESWELHRDVVEWDKKARVSNIVLDNSGPTPIRQFMAQLEGDRTGALLTTLRDANAATLKMSGYSKPEVKAMMEGAEPTGLAQEVLDTRHLHTAVSHLKRKRAAMDRNGNPDGFERHDLDGLIDAIELQMKEGTFKRRSSGRQVNPGKAEQIRSSWENANNITEEFHTVFSSDAMRSLLKPRRVRRDGRIETEFDLAPGFIRDRMFVPNDARFLYEAIESVGGDPAIKQGLADEFMRFVRSKTIRGGKVQQGLYNDMMDQYSTHMDILLGKDQAAQITNLGSMGRIVDNMAMQTEKTIARLKHMYGRTTADPSSAFNISEELLGPRMNARQTRNLMQDLRRLDPELAKQVEEKTLQSIFKQTSKADQRIIDFDRLDTLLIKKRDTLEAIGGRQYVRDLDKLRDALDVLADARFAKASKEIPMTLMEKATRLMFGPLGREQRFISAVMRSARQKRAGTVRQLLEDPTQLRNFIRLKNMSVRDPRFWAGAQLLGPDILDVLTGLDPDSWKSFQEGTLPDNRDTFRRSPI